VTAPVQIDPAGRLQTKHWLRMLLSVPAFFALIGLFLSFFAAASPDLHHWLHADAGVVEHQCLITGLEKKQVYAEPAASLPVSPSLAPAGFAQFPAQIIPRLFPVGFPPERGPPVPAFL
jgi:hypothetical protein